MFRLWRLGYRALWRRVAPKIGQGQLASTPPPAVDDLMCLVSAVIQCALNGHKILFRPFDATVFGEKTLSGGNFLDRHSDLYVSCSVLLFRTNRKRKTSRRCSRPPSPARHDLNDPRRRVSLYVPRLRQAAIECIAGHGCVIGFRLDTRYERGLHHQPAKLLEPLACFSQSSRVGRHATRRHERPCAFRGPRSPSFRPIRGLRQAARPRRVSRRCDRGAAWARTRIKLVRGERTV